MHQPPPQAFGAIGEGFKVGLLHGPQPVEHRPLSGSQTVDRGTAQAFRRLLGQIAFPGLSGEDRPAQGCGGGVFRVRFLGVIVSGAVDGAGGEGTLQLQDGLAVFHSQNVIGSNQEVGLQPHLLQGRLPRRGETDAGGKGSPEGF